jgi:hypothetical protein
MTRLTPADLPGHRYLRESRPEWSASLASIQAKGGPWGCPACGTASMLSYRCSRCGADLASSDTTAGVMER